MVKFSHIIHKETGTVVKYEDWLRSVNKGNEYSIYINTEKREFEYNPKEMLFSDDFEIIYDSEFTTEELQKILKDDLDSAILYKIVKSIDSKKLLNHKYGIEV